MTALREKKSATIIMDECEVVGNIHVPPGGRVSDFLQSNRDFLAVTEAKVVAFGRQTDTEVAMVNRNLIKVLILN